MIDNDPAGIEPAKETIFDKFRARLAEAGIEPPPFQYLSDEARIFWDPAAVAELQQFVSAGRVPGMAVLEFAEEPDRPALLQYASLPELEKALGSRDLREQLVQASTGQPR